MTEQQIVDIWTFFKEHIDKKQLSKQREIQKQFKKN